MREDEISAEVGRLVGQMKSMALASMGVEPLLRDAAINSMGKLLEQGLLDLRRLVELLERTVEGK